MDDALIRSGVESLSDKLKVVDEEVLENISLRAKRSVLRTIAASPKFSHASATVDALPKFDRDELCLWRLLGTGQFGIVHEIKRFDLMDASKAGSGSLGYDSDGCGSQSSPNEAKRQEGENRVTPTESIDGRVFLATHCMRSLIGEESPRYAIKSLQIKYHKRPKLYYLGIKDLAKEAQFLSCLSHPHIVKLRGTAAVGMCNKDYFIVIDRLYGTLKDQIKVWKRRHDKYSAQKMFLMMNRSKKKLSELYEERLSCAFDISSAVKYLHSRNLLHRDLKPANIGFDVRGDVKIFDFGLVVEIPADKEGPYKLTGNTGTMCYMAPEVYYCKLYDERCDVHSFGLVLWEMFALEKAYDFFDVHIFIEMAFEEGIRPPLDPLWPEELRDILTKCMLPDFMERPHMRDTWESLRRELAKIRNVDPELLEDDLSRRSTFVSRHVEPKDGLNRCNVTNEG